MKQIRIWQTILVIKGVYAFMCVCHLVCTIVFWIIFQIHKLNEQWKMFSTKMDVASSIQWILASSNQGESSHKWLSCIEIWWRCCIVTWWGYEDWRRFDKVMKIWRNGVLIKLDVCLIWLLHEDFQA